MLPVDASLAGLLAVIGAVGMLALGALFLFSPSKGLLATKHHGEDLPTIMAGRYFFFAFVMIAVAKLGSSLLLALVFVGFSGVAFFDAATYSVRGKPVMPHLLAGLAALIVPAVALGGQV